MPETPTIRFVDSPPANQAAARPAPVAPAPDPSPAHAAVEEWVDSRPPAPRASALPVTYRELVIESDDGGESRRYRAVRSIPAGTQLKLIKLQSALPAVDEKDIQSIANDPERSRQTLDVINQMIEGVVIGRGHLEWEDGLPIYAEGDDLARLQADMLDKERPIDLAQHLIPAVMKLWASYQGGMGKEANG